MSALPASPPTGFESTGPRREQATVRISYLPGPASRADRALRAAVIRQAQCAGSSLDADQWFPVSTEIASARREAAAAIALCQSCPVRAQCLELSLRQWDVGRHGIWGGLVAAERATLRHLALATVTSIALSYF
jgi:hypothetical protein